MKEEDRQAALAPIASLISKSEKAQRKLAPGTWSHRMLERHLKALRLARILIEDRPDHFPQLERSDLQEAIDAFAEMISRSDSAQAKFEPGSTQHSLLRNRIAALRFGVELIETERSNK